MTLFVNDRQIGRAGWTTPFRSVSRGYAGMDIGRDNGGVVDHGYEDKKPFAFTGTVKKVVFDITPNSLTRTNWTCIPHINTDRRRTHCQGDCPARCD